MTPEQLSDLAGRLKDAEARLPAVLAQVYRHVIVATDKKALRAFDMGVSTYDGRTTISDRVYNTLKDNEQLLEQLAPALLIGKRWSLWPDDDQMVNAKTMAGYFTQLTHLPMLSGSGVLCETISRGVERGVFAYALGDAEAQQFDTIRFKESMPAEDCELSESAWLLRPALAKELLPEPESVETGGTTPAGGTTTTEQGGGELPGGEEPPPPSTGPKIVEGERRYDWVHIKARVPWEQWGDFYNEVIEPLANEGADIRVDVSIIAKGDAAIRENTVEFGIKESLSQRGIDAEVDARQAKPAADTTEDRFIPRSTHGWTFPTPEPRNTVGSLVIWKAPFVTDRHRDRHAESGPGAVRAEVERFGYSYRPGSRSNRAAAAAMIASMPPSGFARKIART